MARLLFEKKGKAIWISHLDLMRLFQRAFKRAGLHLKHTQGYNPRPSVSIALPLSVGVESRCELLDFDLEGDAVSLDQVADLLNNSLVEGVQVLAVYEHGSKLKELAYLNCLVRMQYNRATPDGCVDAIAALFRKDTLVVEKKSKNGMVEQDIIPMIKKLSVSQSDKNTIVLDAVFACQNPAMNPLQLVHALERYLPEWKPDHVFCCRKEIFDHSLNVFR